jgi:hypothetical protein
MKTLVRHGNKRTTAAQSIALVTVFPLWNKFVSAAMGTQQTTDELE